MHNAHLAVARTARDAFSLDRVLLIPNAIPPHKQDSLTAPYEDRLAMVRLAVESESSLEASDLEADTGKSYSIRTIEKLKATLSGEDRLYFIIGGDAFAEITTWYRWREVVNSVAFIVVARPGHTWEVPEGATVLRLDSVHLEVSSSAIRAKLAVCEEPAELPHAVFEYVRKHKLYRFGSGCAPQTETPLTPDHVSG